MSKLEFISEHWEIAVNVINHFIPTILIQALEDRNVVDRTR